MELLESNDMKSALARKSARHREALDEEVKEITARTEKIVTNALIIGGALALTYLLVRGLSGTKGKSKGKGKLKAKARTAQTEAVASDADDVADENAEGSSPAMTSGNNVIAHIGTALASQAMAMLLSLAKEKLAAFLEAQSEKKKTEV